MSHYKIATVAPVHLKIVVSFLLSILLAATVSLFLRSALRVGFEIDQRFGLYETHRP